MENALAYSEIAELKDRLAQEKLYLEDELRGEMDFEGIVGQSSALRHVLNLVETVAPSDSTVLMLGETGTGKELIARAIHDRSRRKDRTFVKVNCAAIPTGLLESELFGHERGAFTGAISQKIGRLELADQGTLFLDEVGDIPLEIQPKLLRALQEREFERLGSTRTKKVDVRLVAATNRDLGKMIENREFRSRLVLPAERLSHSHSTLAGTSRRHTSAGALLRAKIWPPHGKADRIHSRRGHEEAGELALAGKYSRAGKLHRALGNSDARSGAPGADQRTGQQRQSRRRRRERGAVNATRFSASLKDTKGRVAGPTGAAERMGLKRTTLISRMKKLGIDPRKVY